MKNEAKWGKGGEEVEREKDGERERDGERDRMSNGDGVVEREKTDEDNGE